MISLQNESSTHNNWVNFFLVEKVDLYAIIYATIYISEISIVLSKIWNDVN